jgi:hypothetical protein
MHSVLKYALEVSIKEKTENRGWVLDLLHRPLLFTKYLVSQDRYGLFNSHLNYFCTILIPTTVTLYTYPTFNTYQ